MLNVSETHLQPLVTFNNLLDFAPPPTYPPRNKNSFMALKTTSFSSSYITK